MYMKSEIMFHSAVTPVLRDIAGSGWRRLVDRVTSLDDAHPESLAFSLMMIRLDSCMECETDSFRAMRGCVACALQVVRRYRNNEAELLQLYKAALKDVQAYLKSNPRLARELSPAHIPLKPARLPRRSTQPAAAR